MNLEKVSSIIVDQSLKDQVFSKEAGRICYTIVQVGCVAVCLQQCVLMKTTRPIEAGGFKELEQDLIESGLLLNS